MDMQHAQENAKGWLASIEEMTQHLENVQNEDSEPENEKGREDAQQTIHESVLSVQVRGGWHTPGSLASEEACTPEEYEILLSTGGPALRIIGRLNQYCEPESAELQMQDWGTPWTRYAAPEATLLLFAQQFFFGE